MLSDWDTSLFRSSTELDDVATRVCFQVTEDAKGYTVDFVLSAKRSPGCVLDLVGATPAELASPENPPCTEGAGAWGGEAGVSLHCVDMTVRTGRGAFSVMIKNMRTRSGRRQRTEESQIRIWNLRPGGGGDWKNSFGPSFIERFKMRLMSTYYYCLILCYRI